MNAAYELDAAVFAALASGYGDGDAVQVLQQGQLNQRLLMLRRVLDTLRTPRGIDDKPFRAGFALLSDIQAEHPDTVRDTLLHPFVGTWSRRCLLLLEKPTEKHGPMAQALEYFGALALSAALRSQTPYEVRLSVRDGSIFLPTLGELTGLSGRTAVVGVRDGDIVVDGRTEAHGWQPILHVKTVAADHRLTVRIDDLDPHRSYLGTMLGRQDPQRLAVWQDSVISAWDLLATHHHAYREAIAAGLRSITPQASPKRNTTTSSSVHGAFGAMSASSHGQPVDLALAMVHEFQHNKLSALIDLVPLHDHDDGKLYHAPWRDDPRPAAALLQGVYAHVGVVDFWRIQRELHDAEACHLQFALWRELTTLALPQLLNQPTLTTAGRHLVDRLAATIDTWADEPVAPDIAIRAHKAALARSERWRSRNGLAPIHC